MNYLAHLFLAGGTPEFVLGGMLGDFVKGAIGDRFSPRIRQGIALHRSIDCYTDEHERVRASRALVSAQRRRFAGIMVDVFYDHFLARHWRRYAALSLADFTREVYAILMDHREDCPERMQYVLPRMVAGDWLGGYRELDGVAAAVNGISRRFRRTNTLTGAVSELEANYARFERHFLAFFPELMGYADRCRREGGLMGPNRWVRPAADAGKHATVR